MIHKFTIPLLLSIMLLQSCLGESDPLPASIDTYHYYYNYLLESYALQWEIDETIIGSGHAYGIPAEAIVTLNETEQEVLIRSRNNENGQLIDSLSYTMFENGAYMIALMGSEEEANLICEVMDTRIPSAGNVKFRFLHAAESMGPVDIYIGGDQPEFLVLTDVGFAQVSEYLENTELQLWTSIIVAPANSLPADSTILEYKNNTVFQTGGIFLCTIEHISSSSESPYQMQADFQPVF